MRRVPVGTQSVPVVIAVGAAVGVVVGFLVGAVAGEIGVVLNAVWLPLLLHLSLALL